MKRPPIEAAILRLKYHQAAGWATIFGRLLLGHLQQDYLPGDIDLIVANPTLADVPGRLRHTELVIDSAYTEDLFLGWPFDINTPRAIVKVAASPKSAGASLADKIAAADALADVLHVPEPDRVAGRRVLIYDDVCTTGYQLDRVARVLVEKGGAASVEGLVLARAPWGG
jgi:predicted amidophosphoribosyltransferase